jgi:hypothetical protein
MDDSKYIGMDVPPASIVAVVLDASGKVVRESILETRGRLSRILCLGASWFLGFESAVKDGVERIEGVLEGGGDAAPASGFERRNGETELEFQGVFRMKGAAAVAAQDFERARDGLDDVRRGPGAADRIRIVQESQVRVPFFADLAHEARGAGLQVLTKVLELCGGDLGVAGGFQGAEALIEFGRIGLREVALGLALEVNDTELDVGLRKQALGEGEEAGEVVVDPPQETPQAAEDVFPFLEVLAPEAQEAGEDTLLAITAEANDQGEGARTETVALLDFDLRSVEEEGPQRGVERAGVAQFEFFDEAAGDGVEFLLGGGPAQLAPGALGGIHGTAGSEPVQ